MEALGSGKRPAVTVTLNGDYSYRSTVAVMGGQFLIPLAAEHREGAGVSAGDEVEVTLDLDTAPREVEVPEDFQAALEPDTAARHAFEAMSYSNKRRLVLAIEAAKKPETRARRVETTVEELREGRA